MTASARVIDFTVVEDDNFFVPIGSAAPQRFSEGGGHGKPLGRPATNMSRKSIRRRARRKIAIANEEIKLLYGKGIEDWDMEELARGRCRDKNGYFSGPSPQFVSRALHEESMKRFETVVKSEMNAHTVAALTIIGQILEDDREDHNGKPLVSATTKLDAAKFLVEHVIGKPKQHTSTDISVKLQGILGMAMVNPTPDGGVALTQGYIEADSYEEGDEGE
jgi:hypothetical protein